MGQVWKVNLPLRGVSIIKDSFDINGDSYQIRGRELVPEIDCSPLADLALHLSKAQSEMKNQLASAIPDDIMSWLKSVPVESLGDVFAPHALAPFKRSGEMHSSIGATEMPSPHQFTIWPSLIEMRVTGSSDFTSILNKLTKICTDTWGITLPIANGYHRLLTVSDTTRSTNAFDFRGNVRDFGVNDLSEFQLTIPGQIAFPGSYKIDAQAASWSCVIPSVVQPNSPQEAATYAKRLGQIMTDLGNLWALERYEAPDHFSDGSNAVFTRLIILSFEKIVQLMGFFNLYRQEIEQIAANWQRVRNREGHEPSPLLRSSFDLGSIGSIVGTITGKQVSKIALNMGVEIVNRTSLFPTSALQ